MISFVTAMGGYDGHRGVMNYFAIGSVIPNRRVSASRVFTKNQRFCPPLNIKNNFNRNSIFDRHCSFNS